MLVAATLLGGARAARAEGQSQTHALAPQGHELAQDLQADVDSGLADDRIDEALAAAEELLELREQQQGSAWYETIDARLQRDLLQSLLALAPADRERVLEAGALTDAYGEAYAAGDFATALRLARQQVELRSRHLGARHPSTADSMMAAAVFSKKLDQLDAAQPLYEQALEIHRATLGERHPILASDLRNYGAFLKARGEYFAAVDVYREALALSETLLGPEHRDVAWSLNNLAAVLYLLGQYEECETCHRRALALNRTLFESPHARIADSLNNLADIRRIRGDYAEAEALFGEALEIYRQLHGERHPTVATCLNNMAQMACATGKLAAAEERVRAALDIYRTSLGPEHSLVAAGLQNLGSVLVERGDFDAAEEAMREALAIRERLGADHPLVAESLSSLAFRARARGEFESAEELSRRSLAICEHSLGADGPETADAARNLASILLAAGAQEDQPEVERLLERALESWRRSGDPRLQQAATQLADFLRLQRHEPTRAIALYSLAIAEFERLRPQVAGDELMRAEYASRLSRLDPVGGLLRAHIASAEASPLSDAQAFSVLEGGRGRALLDLLSRRGLDLFELARARAERSQDPRLLRQLLEQRARQTETDGHLLALENELRSLAAAGGLYRSEVRTRVDELKAARIAARQSLREDQSRLFELARSEWADRGLRPMGLAAVAELLQPEERLLVYDIGESDSFVFVLRGGSEAPDMRILELRWPDGSSVGAAPLRKRVQQAVEVAARQTRSSADAQPDLRALAGALLPATLRGELEACARVLLVPDGSLNQLPFELLPFDLAGEQLWLERGPPILYGPSATVLASMRSSAGLPDGESARDSASRTQLVAVCDPIFERVESGETQPISAGTAQYALSTRAAYTRGAFSSLAPLPGTRLEVNAIVGSMNEGAGRVVVLAGEDASLPRLEQELESPRFLHFATHGIVLTGERVYESALALTVPRTLTPHDTGFLRLGDLLTGWEGRLEGSELVTLSACSSARGALQTGEGFVGLSWGFLLAGARSVLASLWDVDDNATALLMARFYSGVLGAFEEPRSCAGRSYPAGRAMPKLEALHEAKRWLRALTRTEVETLMQPREVSPGRAPDARPLASSAQSDEPPFVSPFYWAAFVLLGDGS